MSRIFLSPPHMSDEERRLLLDAFDSNWIAPLGPHVDGFEREIAAYSGVPHAAALSSGTAALHLALMLHDVGPGDVVLCATFTFAATANAIRYMGAEPVFIDSTAADWCMDPELVEQAIQQEKAAGRTVKAVIPVDLYGLMPDYERLEAVCDAHGVALIEDAAEGLGSRRHGRMAGGFGRCGVFSFNGNKIMTTSGGGMLVSDDPDLITRARYLSTQARQPVPHYEHVDVGYNYRLSNLLAAVGRGQLSRLDGMIAARARNKAFYREHLGSIDGITLMPDPAGCTPNHWLTCVTIDPTKVGVDREQVRRQLESDQIEARPLWKPMHLQPVFSAHRKVGGAVSEGLFDRGLCLPSGSSLTQADLERVVQQFLDTPGFAGSTH